MVCLRCVRNIVLGVVCLAGASVRPGLAGECTPILDGRKISIVVPYKPGGGYDTYARLLAPVLEGVTGSRVAVSNLPGGGGAIAMNAVARARNGNLMVGVFNPLIIHEKQILGHAFEISPEALVPMGAFLHIPRMWVSRKDVSVPLATGRKILVSDATVGASTLIQAAAAGIEIQRIKGYSGSADLRLALLRGDIDAAVLSAEAVRKMMMGGEDLQASLAVTSGPAEGFPATPYLAGPGGLAERRAQALSGGDRVRRMELAQLAVWFSDEIKALMISSNVSGKTRQCLLSALEGALFSEALHNAAQRNGLEMAPRKARDVQRVLDTIRDGMNKHRTLLEKVISDSGQRG